MSEDEELGKKSEPTKPSLTKALYRSFGKRFFTFGFLQMVVECIFRYRPRLLDTFKTNSLLIKKSACLFDLE